MHTCAGSRTLRINAPKKGLIFMTILTGSLIGLTATFFMWLLKDKKRGLSEAAGAYVLFLSSFFFHTPATAMATALVLLGYGICLCFIK